MAEPADPVPAAPLRTPSPPRPETARREALPEAALHVVVVFLDGVGIGPPGEANPLTVPRPALRRLAGGADWTAPLAEISAPTHVVRTLDATLGVPGLPQSGTGQAALYTGLNAPALAGRHYGPTPHSATFEALRTHSLWRRLLDAGVPADALAFANAYPDAFFAAVAQRGRWPTAARMTRDAGLVLRGPDHVRAGTGLAADITAEGWRRHLGADVAVRTPEEAGAALHALARRHRVTLFEHYHTDEAGHTQDRAVADATLDRVDRFLGGLLDALDPARDLLVVTSDHGNLEDLSVRTHTTNPVPLLAVGARADALAAATSLDDVTPALVRAATGR